MGIEMEYGFVISDSVVYVNPNLQTKIEGSVLEP